MCAQNDVVIRFDAAAQVISVRVPQRTEHQPLRNAGSVADSVRRHGLLLGDLCRKLLQVCIDIFHGGKQNELLFGTGHRDVKHAQLLCGSAFRRCKADGLADERGAAHAGLGVCKTHADTELWVHAQVVRIIHEFPAAARDDAHGKLQAL